ncbi:betaine--homocysteine S-methyltransferase 1-like [Mizuhopecten yessoensis]|uniref:betaine--homocysteine S-methyltransferase 1-like n=1 Tax=Mizuhopecten yessoensis TaxID=6573 RepID=UPI000B45815C|nr:betaine--homocysteine S-methyltransferase 1-like [Mizuhopecten yessoensis]
MPTKGLLERLRDGESVVVAEGYIFEFERRGYLTAGSFVPEVIIEHPELVKSLHEEFVHAGSDVVLAFTYYAHREKLRLIGRENDLERMNMEALRIAREVADDTGTLMAGNICNSTIYKKGDDASTAEVKAMFKEQVEWAVKGGADFIVGETFGEYGEAALALEAIKKHGNGLPAVITLQPTICMDTQDGINIGEACRMLEEGGADVVGLNCGRGPVTIIETLKCVRRACKVCGIAIPDREEKKAFPLELLKCLSSRDEIRTFAQEAKAAGATYIGLCCGGAPHTLRIVADVLGKNPPANKYAPQMHKHFIFGDESKFQDYYTKDVKSKIVTNA